MMQVLFGTNFPQLSWERCINSARDLPLSEPNMERFMHKNAEALFKLPPTPPIRAGAPESAAAAAGADSGKRNPEAVEGRRSKL